MNITFASECKSAFLEDYMVVWTSAMIQTELDRKHNQILDFFNQIPF